MSMWGALGLPALIVSIGICFACVTISLAYARKLNAEALSEMHRDQLIPRLADRKCDLP
jgi:hypothetical protein